MAEDLFLSVVIPAYNEEGRLPASLEALAAFLPTQPFSSEVVVVDDGSEDDTAGVVERARAGFPVPLRLLRRPHLGKGGAVRAGMLAARGRWRFLCDADLSMPLEDLARFWPLTRAGAVVVIGSREAPGARRFDEPPHRHLMGRVFNRLVQLLALPGIQDSQCGFKLFRADAAERLFRCQRLNGFGFDVEVLYLARKFGYPLAEVGIRWYHKRNSRVHPLRDTVRMLRDLFRVRWNDRRGAYDGC